MTSPELERLVQTGTLKKEPGAQAEIDGLVRSARSRLTDTGHPALASESRFDLACNGVAAQPFLYPKPTSPLFHTAK